MIGYKYHYGVLAQLQPIEFIQLHVNATPIPLSKRCPEASFPEGLEEVVMASLSKKPEERYASAAESVGPQKQRRLRRAAAHYLLAHPRWAEWPCRFDVVSVLKRNYGARVRWIRSAFDVEDGFPRS